jgi:hypothetical protein
LKANPNNGRLEFSIESVPEGDPEDPDTGLEGSVFKGKKG